MTRALIVDDHRRFRTIAHALLAACGYEVVGEAADGEDAVEQARELRPDVVLLDVQLPGMDGFAVAEILGAEAAPPAVVLVSSRAARDYGPRLESSPARGFIPKDELSRETLAAVLAG